MVNIYTQLLLDRHIDTSNKQAQEFAEHIRNGVERLELLIRDLLLYSRAVHENAEEAMAAFTPVDLNRALMEGMKALQNQIEMTRS